MGSDGYQTQRRSSWVLETERAERVLADAITMDGRKECICKVLLRECCVDPLAFAGVASLTSLLVCKENTRRLSLRRIKGGIRDHPPEEVKTGSPVIKKKSSRSCVQGWSCSIGSKDAAKAGRRMESRREEEVVWKRIARWRLRGNGLQEKVG